MEKTKILYDATVVCNALTKDYARSGIFFVAYNVLLEFLKRPEYDVYLYTDNLIKLREVIKNCPEFSNCKIFKFSILQEFIAFFLNIKETVKLHKHLRLFRGFFGLIVSVLKKLLLLNSNASQFKEINVYFSPMNATPDIVRRNNHIKCCTVLHDAIPLIEKYKNPNLPSKWFYRLVKTMNSQDYYFANSNFTKQDFLKYVPNLDADNITVVPLSTGKSYKKLDDISEMNRIKKKYHIPLNKKYIFSLCSLNPRKNLIFSIRNFLKFTDKNCLEDFVMVLGGSYFKGFEEIMNRYLDEYGDIADKILRIGYVDDEDLSALYSGAEMFLYPSLYEGFGMPVLEAMQCGLPVICSNTSSLPEVIGDCGIQIDPYNDDDMLQAMEKMYFDRNFRQSCVEKSLERAKMFTWEKCVDVISEKVLH